MTLEKLSKPHASVPRNPLIADPLFLTKYIEKAGTGTLDMIARCRNARMKLPEYSMDGDFFLTKIWRNTGGMSGGVTGGMTGSITGRTGVNSELTEAQIKVLQIIKSNPKITLRAISNELNINISAVQKHIEKLRKKGVVERIGPSFGGYWKVKF